MLIDGQIARNREFYITLSMCVKQAKKRRRGINAPKLKADLFSDLVHLLRSIKVYFVSRKFYKQPFKFTLNSLDIMRKSVVFLLILSLTAPSLLMVEAVRAQTPSVPEFSVQYIVYKLYIAPTYSTNPYTGQNQTISSGSQVSNQTLKFTIKNQPFAPYTDSKSNYINFYFNFRLKGHYGDNWNYYPFNPNGRTTFSYSGYSWSTGTLSPKYPQSGSEYTTISFNPIYFTPAGTQQIPDGSQVDIQVQAMVGHIDDEPSGLLAGDFYSFTGQLSGWSNIQLLTINYNANSTISETIPNSSTTALPVPTSTNSPIPTIGQTFVPSETATYSPTPTQTSTPIPTLPPTSTPSSTPNLAPTPTSTPIPSESPTPTPSPVFTPTPTQVIVQFVPTWFYIAIVGLVTVIGILLAIIAKHRERKK
jgi:hypothetical protein